MISQLIKPTALGLGMSLAMVFAGNAFAGDCTDQPQSAWMPVKDMQLKILEAGYTIDRFKVDGSCYEIYGRDDAMNKVEIYFNPVTGEVVKKEMK